MNQTATLHARCRELFGTYPKAVETAAEQDFGPGSYAMTLMLADGGEPRFFRLLGTCDDGYAACERGCTPVLLGDDMPSGVREGIAGGWPLPRDGSLFGWQEHGIISALVASYTDLDLDVPEWTLMPHADLPGPWPPFAGESLLGSWFWEHLRAGSLTDLGPLIAGTEGAVFWVRVSEDLGLGCIAVSGDVTGPSGLILPRGVYAYHQVLRSGAPLPSLADLLADPGRADLGPRFPAAA